MEYAIGFMFVIGLLYFWGNFYLACKIDADNAKIREEKAEEERGRSEALLGLPMSEDQNNKYGAYRRGYVKGLVDLDRKSEK